MSSFFALLRLELHKQRFAFLGMLALYAAVTLVGLVILAFRGVNSFDEVLSGCSISAGLASVLAAVFLGISGGQGLRNSVALEQEDVLPVPHMLRATAAYVSGLTFTAVFLLIMAVLYKAGSDYLFLPGVTEDFVSGRLAWALATVIKLHLLSFLAACWISQSVVAGSLGLAAAFVDAMCSRTLWRAWNYFAQVPDVYDTASFLVTARLLMDVLLLILVLYTAGRLVAQLYGKKNLAAGRTMILPMCCVVFGPVTSWLIFMFLMTPAMHDEFYWNFPSAVLFEAAHSLGLE